jgi:hypothetical protein
VSVSYPYPLRSPNVHDWARAEDETMDNMHSNALKEAKIGLFMGADPHVSDVEVAGRPLLVDSPEVVALRSSYPPFGGTEQVLVVGRHQVDISVFRDKPLPTK